MKLKRISPGGKSTIIATTENNSLGYYHDTEEISVSLKSRFDSKFRHEVTLTKAEALQIAAWALGFSKKAL